MNTAVKLCFAFLAVLILQAAALPPRVKRQGFDWGDEGDFNFNQGTTTRRTRQTPQASTPPSGTTTTTPSPQYSACIRRCPKTPQYNPICGTNRVTYPNESHLKCANNCGLNVERAFIGSCSAL